MKTIDTVALSDHLDQQVTGLVTCWIIEREDGEVYRFTDATEDLTVDGDVYSSVGAYKRTAIETTSTLSVDNLDIVGIASDLSLPEQDLRNGLFDNARISVFMCAWSAVVPGKIRLRRGFFGEVQSLPNGTFQVELRGLMQRLSYNYLDMFSTTCLYDLGEPACSVTIRPDQVQRSTHYAIGDVVLAAQSTAVSLGKRYPLTVGDYGFDEVSVSGFDTSLYWYNSGANPMEFTNALTYSGTATLKGATAGAGSTSQVIEIEAATKMPMSVIEEGLAELEVNGFYYTDGNTAQVTVDFLDESHNVIALSKAVAPTQQQAYTGITALTGDFTVSFWIKPTTSDEGGIMHGGTTALGSTIYYSDQQITYYYHPNTITSIEVVKTGETVNGPKVPIGEWSHVAISRSGTAVSIWVNFVLLGTGTSSASFYWDTLFGHVDNNAARYFDAGLIDDIRIYNVAKTHTDLIQELLEPPLPDATLLRWFTFDDNTLNDQTGNDATVPGAGTGTTYSITGAPVQGDGTTVTGWDSGAQSPGTTWTRFSSGALVVPVHAKMVRLTCAANGGEAYFDAMSAVLYDTSQEDTTFRPLDVNDVYWKCTTPGTTATTYPAAYTGGAGASAVDGGAGFTAQNAWLRGGRVIDADDRRTFTATITEPRAVDAWFNGGAVIFVTGANAGIVTEVKNWTQSTGLIELFLSVPHAISTNDEFFIYPGCDKSRISCAAIFNNAKNFFGFPDVPGQDDLFSYPDAPSE